MSITSKNGEPVSLQITHLENVSGHVGTEIKGFLVKNNTDASVSLNVRMHGAKDFITTTFYPGWNPEQLDEIENAPEGIQIGF